MSLPIIVSLYTVNSGAKALSAAAHANAKDAYPLYVPALYPIV